MTHFCLMCSISFLNKETVMNRMKGTVQPWSMRGKMLAYAKEKILPVNSMSEVNEALFKAFPNVGKPNIYGMKEVLSAANEEARKTAGQREAGLPEAVEAKGEPWELNEIEVPGDMEPDAKAAFVQILTKHSCAVQELQTKASELITSRNAQALLAARIRLLKKMFSELLESI